MTNKNQDIRKILTQIDKEIKQMHDYLEFAATENYQYEIARIEIDHLKRKRDRYQELLD